MSRASAVPARLDPAGVVFDLDGVLLDSDAIHAAAFHTVLAARGVLDFVYADHAGIRT